ncbi:site-specific integrase [Devosia sp. SL43]|uniref:site-specific integrase n=1 Tax=Devosia sp. SL43 TaxID=2806348 RepID=UPI001F3FC3E1|nr:site-specific integrase [Devosia sp. SL43]UJW85753.1 site-specific integrase [Devosia sp. SL43]
MAKVKHLHEIKGRFAVRVGVPAGLRGIVFAGDPGSELREWLGTDRKAAERAAPEVVARFYRRIDEAKAQLAAATPTLGSAAKHLYAAELAADDRERGNGGVATLRKMTASQRAMLLRLLVAGALPDDEAEAVMGDAADAVLAVGAADKSLPRADLLKALAEAQLEAMARQEERDSGKVALTPPTSPLLQPEAPADSAPAKPRVAQQEGETVAELLALFHRERSVAGSGLAERTMAEHKVAVRMLEEFLGQGIVARSITTGDMRNYKNALMDTPANYTKRLPGMILPKAIAANKKLAKPFPTLNASTINEKWLSHISTILGWATKNGYLEYNPARGIKVDLGKGYKEPSRVGYSADDLKRLFGSPLFADPAKYETRQWALLVALYTGARSSSEVRRIKLADNYQEQGVWVFDLVEATKNIHSKRLVPLHNRLIELGLLDYVDRLKKRGKVNLFWDWEPEDKINRWFLRTYKAEVGIVDSRKVFHSFRNTLKTALARHGTNRDISDLITGHKDQSVGAIYIGDVHVTMIEAMSDALNRVELNLECGGQKAAAHATR